MSDTKPRVLRVIATAFFLFAVAFIGLSAPLYWNQWKVLRTWPRMQATVVHSGVVALKPVQGQTLYDDEYILSFPVAGNSLTVVVRSNRPSTNYQHKAYAAARLPEGSIPLISYNPTDPADVRLQPGYNLRFFLIPFIMSSIGLAFALIGAILWLLSNRARNQENDLDSFPEIHQRIA
jgi:hypothetical protein